MRRLYYLGEDLDVTQALSERLHQAGISDWNFHVLAREQTGLYSHHIHSALAHHHKDIIRVGEIGALYGALAGFAVAACVKLFASWYWLSEWIDVALIVLLCLLIGGLNGVRLGMHRDNHRLRSFLDDIDAGRHLIMVDVRKQDRARIREMMNMEFPQVIYRGNESTFIRPFRTEERVFPQPVDSLFSEPPRR